MKKIIAWVLALGILLCCLTGCETQKLKKYTDYSFDYFDTVTTIVGYQETKEAFDVSCKAIKEQLQEYHRLYTIYNLYEGVNNLCVINKVKNGAHQKVEVDRRIMDLLLYAKEMYHLTGGQVNVAMGSVLSIWHQYREEGLEDPASAKLPSMEQLRAAAAHTEIEDLILDEQAETVYLADPEMRLDVGAIAKGYAVEAVAQWMERQGYTGYILNVGGNVRAVGEQPYGEGWSVGIENPDTGNVEEPYIAYLTLGEMSLVTSGSYQRYYTVKGKRYHHIIDPETLMPGENFQSVSVLCKNSGKADALFSMSYEEGAALVSSLNGVEALWVLPNGELRQSAGFQQYCE